MARIIYKKGFENQNKLEYIEGIEIELLNGQTALIYPKYADLPILDFDKIDDWKAKSMNEVTALKVEDSASATGELLAIGSPAAKFVRQFKSDIHGLFNLPTLLAAMEIIYQREDINAFAKTIEGADLLKEDAHVSTCFRYRRDFRWVADGLLGIARYNGLYGHYTCVPTVVYKKPQTVYIVTSERAEKKDLNGLMDETKLFANFEDAKEYAKCKFEEVLKFFNVTKDAVRVEEREKENTEELYFIDSNFRHHGTEWYVWVSIQKKEIE